jgi:2-dehydro-3-deoxyphosphogluconate aldolase/(4S)-4-hydroxy-2-oxoglutarate aldolase
MQLADHPIIPVVVLNDARRARLLGAALVAGGIGIAEVTFRTSAAAEAIREMTAVAGLVVGAGTVVNVDQVDRAAETGAQFVVSPGLSPAVVKRSQIHGLPVFPGAVTPTEIMAALDLGLTTVKFFPAGLYGGPAALTALSAPFPHVGFIPTGGVGAGNLQEYLALPNVRAVGGSWMVPQAAIEQGDMETVQRLCAAASRRAAATLAAP